MNKNYKIEMIGVLLLFVFVICLYINHSVKKKAVGEAVDEQIIKSMIIGASAELAPGYGYVICTKENIESIDITKKKVKIGLFDKKVVVDFEIKINSNGVLVQTEGYLTLLYNKKKKTKWIVQDKELKGNCKILSFQ